MSTNDDQYKRANRLIDAALDLPAAERSAFLDRECGGDDDLRSEVQRLLDGVDSTQTVATVGPNGVVAGESNATKPNLSGTALGRYRIVSEVGRGGMGVVYEARDDKLARPVAIKVLPAAGIDARTRERFLREARAAAALNHPNIVAIHDAGEADGRPFLVMEFVRGHSLDHRPPDSLDEAIAIAEQICGALEHAHARGVVHRDLKPGNVLVSREDGRLVAKLTDMGIALTRGAARVTFTGAITGTPAFMSPEQALGQEVDGRADLYSLGVMLYRWAAGRYPFEGDDALSIVSQHIHAPVVPPRAYRPELPTGLEPLILKLLSKTAEARYASATEVREALSIVGRAPAEAALEIHVAIEGLTRGRMVGREPELAQLQQLWRVALDGRSHTALISGEPGVGKTRLAREVTATAQLDGGLVLTGGCYENEATTPYLPFVEAFRRIVRERDDAQLADLLGDTAAEISRLAPEIESRLGPFPDRASLPPQEERLRLFDHVARFLRRLAASGGLLVFFDDLQWADHGSLGLLHYLLRQLASERVLFLGTYREIELDRSHPLSKTLVDWHRERLATRVRLDRLDRDATGRMIATLLGQQEVSAEFVASLHDETEGNPFFIEEIVKALIARGGLVHASSSWEQRATDELVLPQSVKAAIGSRLERVSEPCSDTLRTAAVLGKLFEFNELAAVARRSEDELLDALDEAAAAQLIVSRGGESFAFTHDKIREVLYEELNPIRRRRLHARIAEGLEQLQERDVAVAVEDLAHHFVESGDYEKGLVYADRAARAARTVFAWNEATEMLKRARECAEELERDEEVVSIDEAMGDVAWASGEAGRATEHYERALATTEDADRRNALRAKIGEVYVIAGDPRGREHVRLALSELDAERMPRETAQAMMVEARYLHLRAELPQAAELYRSAVELAEPLGDPDLLVRMLSFVSGTYQHMARFEESDAAARRCIEIGERDNVPTGILLGCEFLAENHIFRGGWEGNLEYAEREEALAREVHSGERYAWSHLRAMALYPMGRLAEAMEVARRGIEECGRTGDLRLELYLRTVYAACLADVGQVDEGAREAQQTVRESDEADLVSHRVVCRGYTSAVLLRQGRLEDAAREARVAVQLWIESGSKGVGLTAGATLAEALARGGTIEETRTALDAHLALVEETGAEPRLWENHRVRALLAAREGRTDEALALLDRALAGFEASRSTIDRIRGLGDRAGLLRGVGRAKEAEADRARARELADACGASHEVLGLT